ncbi:hypothetical protein Q5H93_00065 [Hymenobacter sp. ASUV-10]|uniref:Uncharacterized protein n=1 Tax=Hymenobacter aranciens TaxID=3063996 RepID=A0ABT9B4L3_9BACT|nr:hypothetical protein [Hymenobacter sp. ASUV-10]MDO7873108.1 hypothetical protein [Hymenobacter sp. ASUV-10]
MAGAPGQVAPQRVGAEGEERALVGLPARHRALQRKHHRHREGHPHRAPLLAPRLLPGGQGRHHPQGLGVEAGMQALEHLGLRHPPLRREHEAHEHPPAQALVQGLGRVAQAALQVVGQRVEPGAAEVGHLLHVVVGDFRLGAGGEG